MTNYLALRLICKIYTQDIMVTYMGNIEEQIRFIFQNKKWVTALTFEPACLSSFRCQCSLSYLTIL